MAPTNLSKVTFSINVCQRTLMENCQLHGDCFQSNEVTVQLFSCYKFYWLMNIANRWNAFFHTIYHWWRNILDFFGCMASLGLEIVGVKVNAFSKRKRLHQINMYERCAIQKCPTALNSWLLLRCTGCWPLELIHTPENSVPKEVTNYITSLQQVPYSIKQWGGFTKGK